MFSQDKISTIDTQGYKKHIDQYHDVNRMHVSRVTSSSEP